jgi:DNA-binding NarL/FixJ family response regulator
MAILSREVLILPRLSAYSIDLSEQEERELLRRAAKYTLPYFEVMRARLVLLAAQGLSNDQIAARLDTRREVVSMWRKRFFEERLAGLDERSRPGRPRVFPPRTGRSG